MSWFSDFFGDLTGTGQSSAREQNQMNRDFQEQMSNTEVQRRRNDLEKAGFNPILAAGGSGSGGAASAPSGNAGAGGQGSGLLGSITGSAVNLFNNITNAIGKKTAANSELGSSAKFILKNFGKEALEAATEATAAALI